MNEEIGISKYIFTLPDLCVDLDYLEENKLIISSEEKLTEFGLDKLYISNKSSYELALESAEKILKDVDKDSIDLIIYSKALSENINNNDTLSLFNYSSTRLQYDLGLTNANVININEGGCSSFFSALKVAKDTLTSDYTINRILCVSSDVLPQNSSREVLYNIISDASCAAIIERTDKNKIIAFKQITKGYYWQPKSVETEVLVSYFPTAKFLIESILSENNLKKEDIKLIIPHNVSKKSWELLSSLLKIEKEKIYLENISKYGHTIAADAIINYTHVIENNKINKDDYVLMFTFGFGSTWSAMIIKR